MDPGTGGSSLVANFRIRMPVAEAMTPNSTMIAAAPLSSDSLLEIQSVMAEKISTRDTCRSYSDSVTLARPGAECPVLVTGTRGAIRRFAYTSLRRSKQEAVA